ncbi:GntR family transcriptional regulator [Azospirillum sp. SYSU D00513]|uniref:GntR family transcriptional regulator n=1 Tax=Azospirillum sp. SYSU D00513 TaxID=2812561 RepID=UPI001A9735B2|nr:GntR family transcriptional regulator [Azospirillum sp. SYSU D00513]
MKPSPARPRGAPAPEERIHRSIADAIADRRLPPGTRLVEEQLAELFGVSRARIRKVLLMLAQSRLVTLERNRGAMVAVPSAREAREVFHARRLIEEEIVRLLTAEGGGLAPDAAQRLRRHLDREAAALASGDRAATVRLTGEFHQLLATVSGHAVFGEILDSLIRQSSLAIAVFETPAAPSCTADEHRMIVEALERGDGDGARRLLLDHLHEIEQRLELKTLGDGAVDLRRVFAGDAAAEALAEEA